MKKRNYNLHGNNFNNYAKTKFKQDDILKMVFYFPILNHRIINVLFDSVDYAIFTSIREKYFKSDYWIHLERTPKYHTPE